MRMILMLLCTISWISLLSACTSNVVPQRGPTMEQIYDSVGKENRADDEQSETNIKYASYKDVQSQPIKNLSSNDMSHDFRKLPNPELKMSVFPHLAGNEDIPIPGYFTAFNVYERDHYIPQRQWSRG
jgi:conjugative transfer region lipoprotein (TIGR03751 family)